MHHSSVESESSEKSPSKAESAGAEQHAGTEDGSPTASDTTLGAIREPQRLHPLTLLLRVGASLPALALVLLPLLQNPDSSGNVVSVVLTILYGVVALPAILLQYWRFSYRISPKQIVIQKGVLNRKNRSIPIERVQNIQIEQNLFARMFGISKVKIETAGSSSTEGNLEYVGLDQAHKLRHAVRSFQRRTTEADPASEESTVESDSLFEMQIQHVLLSGAFRFSLLYLAVVFSVLQFFDPESIADRLMVSRGAMEQITNAVLTHPALAILLTVVLAVLLGWISGIAVHVARYYGFQLWLDDDKLRKRHGLFTVTEGTVPLNKVQTLILRTNPFMRAFGWYELKVQTIGLNVEEQGHRVIAPFAQLDRILELANQIRTLRIPTTFDAVSPITIRRRFIRYTAVLAFALLPTVYLWPSEWIHLEGLALPWWGFALIPFILAWAVLQYKNHEYAVREDGFYIRRGVLSHYLWMIPVEKFHVFTAAASIFQQRLNLKTLYVDTAGAARFEYPEVIDIPADEADRQLEFLYERFKTLYRNRIEEATGAPDTRLGVDERPRLPAGDSG